MLSRRLNLRRSQIGKNNASDGAASHSLDHGNSDCMTYQIFESDVTNEIRRLSLEQQIVGMLYSDSPYGCNDNKPFNWQDIT
ncbi:hypothetical protein GJ496_008875 [Pomphorhynchus laevis]|nr:hypothetical protein GJ496_008875 [Pomphorhynchus laevis]